MGASHQFTVEFTVQLKVHVHTFFRVTGTSMRSCAYFKGICRAVFERSNAVILKQHTLTMLLAV